ncbi:nucleotidyltransferase substrate binding protein [Marinilactibacillus piezotolerans]|uniref:nucleotidyltransferase substrate binding protein n=1 Tax=Marinilactibacillus piezotolerans TaxID=258723 RepID=UPI0009B08344|nr:nucleotidyltransferase substrate binding protein [Marinilactibacillus piezotolerans]
MTHPKEIRWKLRYTDFDRAFRQLAEGIQRYHSESFDKLLLEGIIHRFEYTFELTCKTLKDYLESKGELVRSPKSVIKKSFEYEFLENGTLWIDMLNDRNLLSHTYDEKTFKEAFDKILNQYYPAIQKVHHKLEGLYNE